MCDTITAANRQQCLKMMALCSTCKAQSMLGMARDTTLLHTKDTKIWELFAIHTATGSTGNCNFP